MNIHTTIGIDDASVVRLRVIANKLGQQIEALTDALNATQTPAPATQTPAPATQTPAPATQTPAPATQTPAPAAPATQTPAPAAPATTAEVDAVGIPWDARIHTSTRSKVADGTWRKKPRVDPVEYDRVIGELRVAVSGTSVEASTAVGDGGSEVTTLTQLMQAIRTQQIPEPQVTAACKEHGLDSLMLVGARLDLIPAIAKTLGL